MFDYYDDKLSAKKLKHAYELAPPRTHQYLRAEVEHVLSCIHPGDMVLELGCGYGRILPDLAGKAGLVLGIDTSIGSLLLAREMLRGLTNYLLANMDAVQLSFPDHTFDCVVCIQNGISAFHVDHGALITEAVRVVKPGGTVLFSSYSDKFWRHRLEWIELQSREGLLGEIDYERTGEGLIVCKDGFTATTVSPQRFLKLSEGLDADVRIVEVDESSIFCEITRTIHKENTV